jgi:hypothetical protein
MQICIWQVNTIGIDFNYINNYSHIFDSFLLVIFLFSVSLLFAIVKRVKLFFHFKKMANTFSKKSKGYQLAACKMTYLYLDSNNNFVSYKKVAKGFPVGVLYFF